MKPNLCHGLTEFQCFLTSRRKDADWSSVMSHNSSADGAKFIAGYEGYEEDSYPDNFVRSRYRIMAVLTHKLLESVEIIGYAHISTPNRRSG